jgi:hypothetical protein
VMPCTWKSVTSRLSQENKQAKPMAWRHSPLHGCVTVT